jgi:hypothetical protein
MSQPPDIAPILTVLDEALHGGRCLEAAAALRALSRLVPEDLRVRAALARALFAAGLWQEAWDAYEVRFELLPKIFPKVSRMGPNGPEAMPIWRGGPAPEARPAPRRKAAGAGGAWAQAVPCTRCCGRYGRAGCCWVIMRYCASLQCSVG